MKVEIIIKYMIGDDNGYTKEYGEVSLDNPFLPIFEKALNKLKPEGRRWGVELYSGCFKDNYDRKVITLEEYNVLKFIATDENDGGYTEDEKEYLYEFLDLFRTNTEYSFLTFSKLTVTKPPVELTLEKIKKLGFKGRVDFVYKGEIGIVIGDEFRLAMKDTSGTFYNNTNIILKNEKQLKQLLKLNENITY